MKHRLRRTFIAFVIVIVTLAAALTLSALLLPTDATKHVRELRGSFGAGDEIEARRDTESWIRHIALRNDRGEILATAWIRRPIALSAGYRVLLTYAGADTGDRILRLIPARDDLVVVAVQYPWKPPRTVLGRLRAVYDIRQAAYRTVAAGIVAVDYLTHAEHLDSSRILLLGASLGSIFATIHGAIDQRVPRIVLVHGGADLASTLEAQMRDVPVWLRPAAVRIARTAVGTFDPAHYVARIAPRHLLVIAARDDWQFPADAVVAFFNRARQPKELRWTNTTHVGVRNVRIAEIVMAEVTAYLGSDDPRPGTVVHSRSEHHSTAIEESASSVLTRSRPSRRERTDVFP